MEGKLEMFDKAFMALEDAKKVIRDEISDKVRLGLSSHTRGGCPARGGSLSGRACRPL